MDQDLIRGLFTRFSHQSFGFSFDCSIGPGVAL